jgi:hypothetical protein
VRGSNCGYKILTKWPTNPPTKAGVTEWYSVKTIYSYFPKDLQEYALKASVPGLVPQVLLPKGSGRAPAPPIEAIGVEAEASGSDWLDRNISDVPSVAMDPGSNMFGPHHPYTVLQRIGNGLSSSFSFPVTLPKGGDCESHLLNLDIELHLISRPLSTMPLSSGQPRLTERGVMLC